MVDLKEVEKELYDVESRRMTEEQYLANRIHQKQLTHTGPVNYPDAKKHQVVSFIKSGIRIAGYILLAADMLVLCAIVLILSEIIGIYEELV
tara:strand:- start:332 stop:607 length:276 start_codon:yes stop_codon:yes gene_type:complete